MKIQSNKEYSYIRNRFTEGMQAHVYKVYIKVKEISILLVHSVVLLSFRLKDFCTFQLPTGKHNKYVCTPCSALLTTTTTEASTTGMYIGVGEIIFHQIFFNALRHFCFLKCMFRFLKN